MKDFFRNRLALAAQITVLVAQVIGIGIALDAKASDSSEAKLAQEVMDYRLQIQQRARGAIKMTQTETKSDLEVKLNQEESS